jgi:hypothetical protein
VKQYGLLLRPLAAPNGIKKCDHRIVMAAQPWVQCRQMTPIGRKLRGEALETRRKRAANG